MMKKACLFVLFVCLSAPLASFSRAEGESAEEIKIYLGQIKAIEVNNPTRIAIGNPEIADVTEVTKEEITITPKSPGRTTLVFWDNYGEQSCNIKVFAERLDEVKERIDKLLTTLKLTEVYTQAEEEVGKVLLLGNIRTSQERERMSLVLGPLKEKTIDLIEVKEEESVVEIDVQVLELNKDASRTLGFSWPGSTTLTEKESPGLTGAELSNVFEVVNFSRAAFTWTLDALIQEGKAEVLSRPRLACQSGKEAELLVGGEKPIFTTQVATAGGEGTSVEYKEYGIKLKIKPIVTAQERIKLSLNVEVSDIGTAETIGDSNAPSAKAYPLLKRSTSTELSLDNEQTLAIGGLIRQKTEEDLRKVPWLGDVPVLGLFFRKKATALGGGQGERGNTELFITLTPRIVGKTKIKETPVVTKAKPQPVPVEALAQQPKEALAAPAALSPQQEYAALVQRRIVENLNYPAQAKEAGFQGKLKLGLLISFRGQLLEAKIKESCGYQILDDETLRVAKAITSYPPFPSSIELEEFWIDIPIDYQLDN
jgi:pilus assembly protein CpaC